MKSLQSINFKNKKALIRVDFNVPLNAQFQVTDSTRIVSAKPTIMKVLEDGGSCVLMSHLGRPESKESAFSLKHIVRTLETVLGVEVLFSSSCIGEDAQKFCDNLKPGQILLLENLRYHSDETRGSENFAKELSKLGDFYINDAFGTAHRAHASTTIIAKFFPENRCFGSLLAQEIESIDKVMQTGEKPVLAILGGAKVSSKITIIDNILNKVDHLIIGGGMTFTFVKAQGGSVGDSICEDDKMELALQILERAKAKNVQVHIPVDVLAADEFSNHANTQIVDVRRIPENWQGLDCGPKSKALFHEVVQQCKTILWNGPLGVFEMEKFSTGTIALGNSIAEATKNGAFSLVGGGDSVSAVKQFGFENKVSYVSTGGGAMIESLEGKILTDIAAFSK